MSPLCMVSVEDATLIHHYTNIEALALILQTKKIRFNRLDRMDDLEEGRVEALGIPLGKYTYVSCWTEDEEESIPLWKMYAGQSSGVRISLPIDMFKDYSILDAFVNIEGFEKVTNEVKENLAQTTTWKVPPSEYFDKKYFVIPVYSKNLSTFYQKVEYVEDVLQKTNQISEISSRDNGTCDVQLKLNQVGLYKQNRWSFQNESRFVLHIFPLAKEFTLFDPDKCTELINGVLAGKLPPCFETYDMSLKDEIFNKLEITLSPSITSGQRIIVDSLVQQYAPNAVIKESSLFQRVR